MVKVQQFDVFLVSLDPTRGSEINKIRPCLVISPNDLNLYIKTVIVAPMTTKGTTYPTRVHIQFLDKLGQIVLDQIRTVDKSRLIKKLGTIENSKAKEVLKKLQELFS